MKVNLTAVKNAGVTRPGSISQGRWFTANTSLWPDLEGMVFISIGDSIYRTCENVVDLTSHCSMDDPMVTFTNVRYLDNVVLTV